MEAGSALTEPGVVVFSLLKRFLAHEGYGVALNVRYLQRRKIPSPVAVASIAVSQVVALTLHILLLATFGAIAGTGSKSSIRPPTWAYFVVAGLVVLAGAGAGSIGIQWQSWGATIRSLGSFSPKKSDVTTPRSQMAVRVCSSFNPGRLAGYST